MTGTFIRLAVLTMVIALSMPAGLPLMAQPSPGGGVPPMFPLAAGSPAVTGGGHPGIFQEGETTPEGRKSVGLGVLYSLLLPGMGELYAGGYSSGKYFTAAEGVLWLALGAIDLHARSLQDDARSFASLHAGFNQAGKDDSYFINIGNFSDVWSYNEAVLRDRDAYKLYDPQSPLYWNWDSDANRDLYRDQRVASDQMFNNTRFVAAAIAVNHVLSAINAARLIVSGNRALSSDGSLDLGASVLGGIAHPHGIALSVSRRF
jgi:hypothetical protein